MAEQRPKVSVLDFFQSSKPIEKITVKRGQTDGRHVFDNGILVRKPALQKRSHGRDYVEEFKRKLELEEKSTEIPHLPTNMEELESLPGSSADKSLLGVEGLSTLGVSRTAFEVDGDELTNVYDNFDFTPVQPKGLTIENSKDEILRMIESNQCVIIEGATGCGKSTQVPQYILDQHASRKLPCNIVVTQPRRIAATSIAKWVCQERKWELGSVVGYQIGLEMKTSPETRLLFCTTGVLLEKLISLKDMNKYTHVILDEVHERNQDMDFLMLLVKKLLRTNSKNVKVILMSATFDTKRFSSYFGMLVNNQTVGAPIVEVDLANQKHKVYYHYLEDLQKIPAPLPEIDLVNPCVTPEARNLVLQFLRCYIDKIDAEDFRRKHHHLPKSDEHFRHCVLIFLPGIRDIEDMFNELGGVENKNDWHIIPLHSSLTRAEQQRVFEPVRIGLRKIVLSTDIAESSVTVPDVKYVIDFCLTKELVADPYTNFTSLQLRWASRTNCKQRAGRTGRVMDGRVYRLVPKSFYDEVLVENKEPEMLRSPLEIVVLKCKILDIGEPRAVLSLALDPPDVSNIERAILLLKEAGGLLNTCRGRVVKFDGDITFMGRIMACLPINIQVSRLVVLGYLFSLLEDTIVIAGMLSVQNVFTTPFKEQIKSYNSKLLWADGSCSDPVAYLNAYKLSQHFDKVGYFESEARSNKRFYDRRHVNQKGLREASELIKEISSRLKDINVIADSFEGAVKWNDDERPLILKTLFAGAFYPNYFLRGVQGGQIDEKDALAKVDDHDIRRCVYLTGLPLDQPGMLYTKAVKDKLDDCGAKMKVFYESNKFIVEFDRFEDETNEKDSNLKSLIPGGVHMAVYRAVKRRLSKMPVTIPILKKSDAKVLAERYGVTYKPLFLRTSEERNEEASIIPGPEVKSIEFVITEVDSPERFWIQLTEHRGVIERLYVTLNEPSNLCPLEDVEENDLVAAPFEGCYYRARVKQITQKDRKALVSFIDYGTRDVVPIGLLRKVQNIPSALWNSTPYAIECKLYGVAPSVVTNKNNIWSDMAKEYFRRVTVGLLKGTIYSRVEDVLVLEIEQTNVRDTIKTLTELLVREGYAVECMEGFRSRADCEYRRKLAGERSWHSPTTPSKQYCKYNRDSKEIDLGELQEGSDLVTLKGPFSPLEMQVYGCMRSTSNKQIRIDPQSVNSVLLDSNPEDVHERLLVAAVVTLPGESRNYLCIRNTTLMPNIHGLPPLMALLFAPNVEIRTDISGRKYVSILCGLGCGPKDSTSLFPENDLCMTFDCVIDEKDLDNVNSIRYWMSHLLHTEEGETLPSVSLKDKREGQLKLKEYLTKLLKRQRTSQELSFDSDMFEWKKQDRDKMLVPVKDDDRFIFKLLRRQALVSDAELLMHVQTLVGLIKMPPETPVNEVCKLCNVRLTSVQGIKTHIKIQAHRDREIEIIGVEDVEEEE